MQIVFNPKKQRIRDKKDTFKIILEIEYNITHPDKEDKIKNNGDVYTAVAKSSVPILFKKMRLHSERKKTIEHLSFDLKAHSILVTFIPIAYKKQPAAKRSNV